MSSERLPVDGGSTAPLVERPWAHLANNQLLGRLEWTHDESGDFDPEVVWELARRLQAD